MKKKPAQVETELLEEDIDEISDVILDIKPIKKKKVKEPKEYVNKDEMWQEIHDYYVKLGDNYNWTIQKIKNKGEVYFDISLKLSHMIDDIAIKMGYRPNFISYSYLDEMRGDARTKMFKAIRDCSFKCFTNTKVIKEETTDKGHMIYYYDKKGKMQSKLKESTDVFEVKSKEKWVTFRANSFGYYSRITSHAFLNRIKKEKIMNETKELYQAEIWEKMMATESYQSVRRPKFISDFDENEAVFDSE